MKRKHIFLLIVVVVAIYILIWFVTPLKSVSIHVHDKTVTEPVNYREHRELYHILKSLRYAKPDDTFYSYEDDYSGYHPLDDERKEKLTNELIGEADILYLADTYGIYDYREGLVEYETRLPFELIDIDLLFGGFDQNETDVIANFAAKENNLLIGEHNTFGYPTYIYEGSSKRLQEIFGVSYEGWLVRYYEDLTEVAYWVKLLYTRINGKEFDLVGPALVVVREDSNRAGWYGDLLIFQEDDFTQQYPMIVKAQEDNELLEDASRRVPYLYWVEVLSIENNSAQVIANYEFPLKEEALEKLEKRGIAPLIPAFVSFKEEGQAQRFYFAGDFIDQTPALLPSWLTGNLAIQKFFSYLPGIPPQYSFYFRWYAPVMEEILDKYYK